MNDLLLSEKTKNEIDRFLGSPSHALLLIGRNGYGKLTLARSIAKKLLGIVQENLLEAYPYYFEVHPVNNLISIDTIRDLKKSFLLKTTGSNQFRRVVIIENAESMNEESQNALLKLLEEPPEDSVIILTVNDDNKIKPTVISRMQKIRVYKPNIKEVEDYFSNKGYEIELIRRYYLFSNGAIGIINSFLDDEKDDININYINEAKSIISSSMLVKMNLVDSLSKDKEALLPRLFSLKQIAKAALFQSLNKNNIKLSDYWLNVLKCIQESEDNLAKGANAKLLLTNLFLHM